MRGDLLDIQPEELIFTFELKKQTTCTVELHNKSVHYVAFKVKTTNPKKYSVRPNIGIIGPKLSCDFTVTMQAQRVAPPDMTCKDKFLVQSTAVPAGTTEEQITSSMFSRDDGRYVEESKLRVILSSPPLSPVFSPVNGVDNAYPSDDNTMKKSHALHVIENVIPQQKVCGDVYYGKALGVQPEKDVQEQKMSDSYVIKNAMQIGVPGVQSEDHDPLETAETVDQEPEQKLSDSSTVSTSENHDPLVSEKMVDLEAKLHMERKLRDSPSACADVPSENYVVAAKTVDVEVKPNSEQYLRDSSAGCTATENLELKVQHYDQLVAAKTMDRGTIEDAEESKLVDDINAMKLKICQLESMLKQAEVTISKLREERELNIQERETFKKDLAMLKTSGGARRVRVGFPLLFVCMVALASVFLGYLLHY